MTSKLGRRATFASASAAALAAMLAASAVAFGAVAYADEHGDIGTSHDGAPGRPGQAHTYCRNAPPVNLSGPLQCSEATGAYGGNGGNGTDGPHGKNGANGANSTYHDGGFNR